MLEEEICPMNVLQAVEQVLAEAEEPLHYREITERILQRQWWTTHGKTPEQTVSARITTDINQHSSSSHFQRTAEGTYALRRWGLPAYPSTRPPHDSTATSPVLSSSSDSSLPQPIPTRQTRSFTDAAEHVLEQFGNRKPMHYRDITKKALELGLIRTSGQTPEATLYAQILTEIARQVRRGEIPRFVKHGKGKVSLSRWQGQEQEQPRELARLIKQHNDKVRQKLHQHLSTMDSTEFEAFIGELLVALGFEEVTVTKPRGDGGIDVFGTLVVGDVIRIRMAVQVKRWKNQNVQVNTVREVRGSLSTHDQGLIITTSDFSEGAREEAQRNDAVPVALMNGEQLVALLVEHDISVHRTSYDLIELGENRDE
jgi:restriction system protein